MKSLFAAYAALHRSACNARTKPVSPNTRMNQCRRCSENTFVSTTAKTAKGKGGHQGQILSTQCVEMPVLHCQWLSKQARS